MVTKGLLLAVDANALLHRAYHAYPLTLTTTDNQPVNAVFGFTSMLLDAILYYKPEYIFCAFDTEKPTFRHTSYVGYKANRPKTDSELVLQLPYAYEVLKALNIPVFAVHGYEADDVLGTVVAKLSTERFHCITQSYILTGDRDLLQLVTDKVQVVMPKGSFKNLEIFDEQGVLTKMGVAPEHVIDLKGLMGDASDNIPGVKGIGPKTALELLTTYHSIEQIYQHIPEIEKKSKRVAQLLLQDEENAVMSKQLATIAKDAPITFSEEDAEMKQFTVREVTSLFSRMQFRSFFPRLNKLVVQTGNEHQQLQAAPDERQDDVDLSVFGVSDAPKKLNVYDMSIGDRVDLINSYAKKKTPSLFIYHNEELFIQELGGLPGQLNGVNVVAFGIFSFLANTPISEDSTNVPEIASQKVLDIELLSYALHTGRDDYSLQVDLLQAGKGVLREELEKDVTGVVTLALSRVMHELLQVEKYPVIPRVAALWKNLLSGQSVATPLAIALYEDYLSAFGVALMHLRGISIDRNLIAETATQFKEKVATIEQEIYDIIGFQFNIRSTKQLANVLFGNLALPNAKKTKTGFSTDDEVLQGLLGAHPVIEKIIEFRQVTKLLSTYMEPYLALQDGELEAALGGEEKAADPVQQTLFATEVAPKQQNKFAAVDNRIHSDFSIMSTTSGRLSSMNPNIQNLPVKTEIGKTIRKFFVPDPGKQFLSIDYSQIDLRVLAHVSQDEGLIEAFKNGQDIHRSTAAKLFHVPFLEVTDKQRRFAKIINFGLIYGMSSFGLAKSIGVEVPEAVKFINEYFEQFPKVKKYMTETIAFGKENGFVISLLGRRRFVPGIASSNRMQAQASEREAINMPIQGGSDDIMRLALGKVSQLPEILSGEVKLVLQVHDELVFELPEKDEEYRESVKEKLVSIMQSIIELDIPLKVDAAFGESLDI
jgi:DNA polymerase-1